MFALLAMSMLMAAEQPEYHPTFEAMVQAANAERAKVGRPPVTIVPGLMQASEIHTKRMVNTRNLNHSKFRVAEIIAAGQRSVAEVTRSWMRSPGHRAVMLGNYKYVGAAGYMPAGGGTRYWTMQFSNTAYGIQQQTAQRAPPPPQRFAQPQQYAPQQQADCPPGRS